VKTFSIAEERSPNAGLTYSLGSSYSVVKDWLQTKPREKTRGKLTVILPITPKKRQQLVLFTVRQSA
jgi:hypothetical protein